MTDNKEIVDLISKMCRQVWQSRRSFLKLWVITFVLACIIILPQPRYYTCSVSISPESAEGGAAGGLASLASSFGLNMGGGPSSDAIYPMLYPDLFESTDFTVGLFDITIVRGEDSLRTDYYTYLHDYQKKNPLTEPFKVALRTVKGWFRTPAPKLAGKDGQRFDPFHLDEETTGLVKATQSNITCAYSKTTDVVTISVKDQDPLTCALLADSVKERLQTWIINYRTRKAKEDCQYYENLCNKAKADYEAALEAYSKYSDAHQLLLLESYKSEVTKLENDMQMKYEVYSAMNTQYNAALAKVQESTPAFTTLQCATVPVKAAGPKRMIFVAMMLVLATIGKIIWMFRKELVEWF